MKKLWSAILAAVSALVFATPVAAAGGFNAYGYNYGARVFVGTGNSWCQSAYQTDAATCSVIMGAYSNDHLVMKWSQAWDNARFNGGTWSTDAWVNNEWNGMFPGGSGYTEIVKIGWVRPCNGSTADTNPNFRPGGYCIWGQFEAFKDQGMSPTDFYRNALTTPNGYGAAS